MISDPGSIKRPLVSYCLLTYNQQNFIRESLLAALAQDYTPLEIVVSDDCSSDGTVAVVEQVIGEYEGPHRIVFNKNSENMGIGAHVSKVLIELASGDYLVTVGGDDVSLSMHVSSSVSCIQNAPADTLMADFSAVTIDENSEENYSRKTIGSPDRVTSPQVYRLQDYLGMHKEIATFAPGRIISCKLLDVFGPIASNCPTEDTVLVLRALLAGGVMRTPDVLIKYRKHSEAFSAGSNLRKVSLEEIFAQYYKDVNTALMSGLIDTSIAQTLFKRLRAEKCLRSSRVNYPVGSLLYYLNRGAAELFRLLYKCFPALIRYEKPNS